MPLAQQPVRFVSGAVQTSIESSRVEVHAALGVDVLAARAAAAAVPAVDAARDGHCAASTQGARGQTQNAGPVETSVEACATPAQPSCAGRPARDAASMPAALDGTPPAAAPAAAGEDAAADAFDARPGLGSSAGYAAMFVRETCALATPVGGIAFAPGPAAFPQSSPEQQDCAAPTVLPSVPDDSPAAASLLVPAAVAQVPTEAAIGCDAMDAAGAGDQSPGGMSHAAPQSSYGAASSASSADEADEEGDEAMDITLQGDAEGWLLSQMYAAADADSARGIGHASRQLPPEGAAASSRAARTVDAYAAPLFDLVPGFVLGHGLGSSGAAARGASDAPSRRELGSQVPDAPVMDSEYARVYVPGRRPNDTAAMGKAARKKKGKYSRRGERCVHLQHGLQLCGALLNCSFCATCPTHHIHVLCKSHSTQCMFVGPIQAATATSHRGWRAAPGRSLT